MLYGLVESCLSSAHCERAKGSLLFKRTPVKMASGILLSGMELQARGHTSLGYVILTYL